MATNTVTLPNIAHQLNIQLERMMMTQELTRQAIESLPNSTDSDAPIALLNGIKDMLSADTLKMHQLSEGVASLAEPEGRMAEQEFTPDDGNLKFAFKYLEEEHETLLALAITLMNRLAPHDPATPEDCADITSWRLAQVLHDRITNTDFLKHIHDLMLGSDHAQAIA